MKTRVEAFRELKAHPLMGKIYKKLISAELGMCERFLTDNDSLSEGEFELKVNRWFLDSPNKPRRVAEMWELVGAANRRAFRNEGDSK